MGKLLQIAVKELIPGKSLVISYSRGPFQVLNLMKVEKSGHDPINPALKNEKRNRQKEETRPINIVLSTSPFQIP